MELREDEIEAILKFDGGYMQVVSPKSPAMKYIAIITGKGRVLTRDSESRIDAVRQVWALYLQYTSEHPDKKDDGYWLYENALGDVEVQLIKNRRKHDDKENGNGK